MPIDFTEQRHAQDTEEENGYQATRPEIEVEDPRQGEGHRVPDRIEPRLPRRIAPHVDGQPV